MGGRIHTEHHQLAAALELDKRILETHALLSRAERDLAWLLAELADTKHFLDLGYANVGQYAQAKLQLEPRKTRGLVRIGRALPELPVLDRAFASGALCWTKARELLAVATPEVEAEWVALACQSTSRELERVVAAHRPGEPPSRDEVKESGPVRLSFSMEPEEAEQVRLLIAAFRAAAGVSPEEVGDGALLAQVATRMLDELHSNDAPTGERFRMVIEHCPSCGRTTAPESEVSETHVGAERAAWNTERPGPQFQPKGTVGRQALGRADLDPRQPRWAGVGFGRGEPQHEHRCRRGRRRQPPRGRGGRHRRPRGPGT